MAGWGSYAVGVVGAIATNLAQVHGQKLAGGWSDPHVLHVLIMLAIEISLFWDSRAPGFLR